MAKKSVQISLATKFRVVFVGAVLLIIAAALVVPWYFMELLAQQGVQDTGDELTRLGLNEYVRTHNKPTVGDKAGMTEELFTDSPTEGRKGPVFIRLSADHKPDPPVDLDSTQHDAVQAFAANPSQVSAVVPTEDRGRTVYRCFRAVRVDARCTKCHSDDVSEERLRFQPGRLAGVIDVTMPDRASGPIVWWTRGAFAAGFVLAAMLAFILLTLITQRLVLRPIRRLRKVADRAADGDLVARSVLRTGDEFERLGESFNEMLSAISDQHAKLRAANRALDLRLNEMAESNVALFQANKVKTEFLANISHELRTPLNSIIGFADLLRESDDERIGRYGTNIAGSARDLLNMINNLLDLAKIEAGKAEVKPDKVSVAETCHALAALMKPLADKQHLTLITRIPEALPIVVTDGGKLQQILYNLLANAVKFTPPGGTVTVSARTETAARAGEDHQEVLVSVADTGPGIAETDQQLIFEKFYQADTSLTRQAGGTGLGLAISKELANLLGGRLSVTSSPGHGVEFIFALPVNTTRRQ